MSTFAFDKLSEDTILNIAETAVGTVEEEESVKDLVKELIKETQDQGIKELAFMMKSLELKDICDKHLHVEYKKGANKNNKMMLTKRFMESFEDKTLDEWFSECENKEIIKLLCNVMDIEMGKKSAKEIRAELINQIYSIGTEIVFHRMTVPQLKLVCEDIGIDGYELTSSKRVLVDSILTQSDIKKSTNAPKTKKVIDTEKHLIGKCTEIDELDQHYSVKKLQEWAVKNNVKSTGTKAVLMERILAFNGGDKENTMVDPSKMKKTKATTEKETKEKDTKKATTKKPLSEKKTTKNEETKKTTKTKKEAAKEVEKEEEDDVEQEEVKKTKKEATKKTTKTKKEAAKEVEKEDEEVEQEKEEKQIEKSKSTKKATKKVEEKEPSEQEEKEDAPEDNEDNEENEEAAIAAERALRTIEPSESELSDSLPLAEKIVTVSGEFTRSQTEIFEIITKLGGTPKEGLTRKTDLLILGAGGKGKTAAIKNNIQYQDEAYLEDLLTKL